MISLYTLKNGVDGLFYFSFTGRQVFLISLTSESRRIITIYDRENSVKLSTSKFNEPKEKKLLLGCHFSLTHFSFTSRSDYELRRENLSVSVRLDTYLKHAVA